MSKTSTKIGSAIAGILAASAMLATTTAQAVPDAPKQWEKCTGVAKKGMNDCGSLDGKHSCGGQATVDNSPNEWVYTPEGTCAKIGGSVAALKPAN